ncbi:MAG: glycoside hydrolase family 10 protein [Gemmatimonadota bacterium]
MRCPLLRPSRRLPVIEAVLAAMLAAPAAGAALSGAPARPVVEPDCGVWVVRNALSSPAAWSDALDAVERVGCRRVYLQVSGRWDAYYPSRVWEPPATSPFSAGWEDPFGQAVADARARGLELHAWVNAMLAWSAEEPPSPDHVFRRHPDWFVTDSQGRSMRSLSRAELDRRGLNGEGWFLDPAVLEVRTELRRFILELVLRYPVAGVHLDYIRYPSGWAPAGGPETVTYLVGLIHDDLTQVRPEVRLSAAVLPVPAEARRTFGQDWSAWLERGIVDEAVPMVYRRDAATVLEIVEDYPETIPQARVRVGVRLDLILPGEVRRAAEELEDQGFGGIALFSHNLLMEDRPWRGVSELLRGIGGP